MLHTFLMNKVSHSPVILFSYEVVEEQIFKKVVQKCCTTQYILRYSPCQTILNYILLTITKVNFDILVAVIVLQYTTVDVQNQFSDFTRLKITVRVLSWNFTCCMDELSLWQTGIGVAIIN